MRKIQVITDSCSDLSQELLDSYGIDYCRMNTVYKDRETPASLLWEYYTPRELYDIMRGGDRILTTQVPPEEFNRVFTVYLEQGYDIIYVGCSTKQSGSVNTAQLIAKKILPNYPEARIVCIDSLNASMGEGMLAIRAAELVREGKAINEIADIITDLRNRVHQYVTVHSLDALRRAGRVKGSAAFFGNLMGVKPILISDADGVQTPIKKVKGRMNSFAELVNQIKETVVDPENQTVYLAHADCSEEEIDALKGMIREKIPCRDIVCVYIGPIIGASIGPDAVGLWCYGDEITYRVGEAK
ncbi:MAG: DegV family protein [Clostridia bacterium]|nr:DegV family protein [Clostridia bacterium]